MCGCSGPICTVSCVGGGIIACGVGCLLGLGTTSIATGGPGIGISAGGGAGASIVIHRK